MKIAKVLNVIFGILMIIGGLYCLFTPGLTYLTLGWVVGFSMVFDAVGRFVGWWQGRKDGAADGWMLVSAILSAVFGFFILNSAALQLGVDVFIAYYAAIWLVIHGIIAIVMAFKIRRLHKEWNTKKLGTHWYLPLCIGILICLFGVLSLLNPAIIATSIGIFIGLGIISTGANMITQATMRV